jgi:DNA-binding CsgD family transcriptional regulator
MRFDRVYRLVAPKPERRPPLTAREREVLAWTAAGKSAWEIGEIDEHAQTAVRKLGAANKIQAVVYAIRAGLIDI